MHNLRHESFGFRQHTVISPSDGVRVENMSLIDRIKALWETTPLHTKVMLGLVILGLALGRANFRGGAYIGLEL